MDGSVMVIAIVSTLIIFIIVVAIVIFLILKRRPELVDRLKKKRGGDEKSVKWEAENKSGFPHRDLSNDEEQLIQTENTVRSENEVKAEARNCASESRSENKVTPNEVHQDGSGNKKGPIISPLDKKLTLETADNTSKDSTCKDSACKDSPV